MGGVVPDTGRNIAGLRNAVSFLIETRGVGIGARISSGASQTHLIAMNSMIDSAAANAPALLSTLRSIREDVAAGAGRGEIVVVGAATPARHTLELLDPESGANRDVEVEWRNALELQVRLKRPRPYAYVLPASESESAARLARLGVTVLRAQQDAVAEGERYRIARMQESRKEDVRRNDEDTASNIVQVSATTEPAKIAMRRETSSCRWISRSPTSSPPRSSPIRSRASPPIACSPCRARPPRVLCCRCTACRRRSPCLRSPTSRRRNASRDAGCGREGRASYCPTAYMIALLIA